MTCIAVNVFLFLFLLQYFNYSHIPSLNNYLESFIGGFGSVLNAVMFWRVCAIVCFSSSVMFLIMLYLIGFNKFGKPACGTVFTTVLFIMNFLVAPFSSVEKFEEYVVRNINSIDYSNIDSGVVNFIFVVVMITPVISLFLFMFSFSDLDKKLRKKLLPLNKIAKAPTSFPRNRRFKYSIIRNQTEGLALKERQSVH